MKPIYKLLLMMSQDFLDVHKYILSRSLKEKDYNTAFSRIDEILDGVKWIKPKLEKHREAENYDVFRQHLLHIEYVAMDMIEIIRGLQAKAERTGKYGWFQYRKDLKTLDQAYDLFEFTGNRLNSLSHKYTD